MSAKIHLSDKQILLQHGVYTGLQRTIKDLSEKIEPVFKLQEAHVLSIPTQPTRFIFKSRDYRRFNDTREGFIHKAPLTFHAHQLMLPLVDPMAEYEMKASKLKNMFVSALIYSPNIPSFLSIFPKDLFEGIKFKESFDKSPTAILSEQDIQNFIEKHQEAYAYLQVEMFFNQISQTG